MLVNRTYKFRLYPSASQEILINKTFIQVDTYYPSSQLCSSCSYRDSSMKDLNKREYKCPKCGSRIERDLNSSINIMIEGIFSYMKNKLETV